MAPGPLFVIITTRNEGLLATRARRPRPACGPAEPYTQGTSVGYVVALGSGSTHLIALRTRCLTIPTANMSAKSTPAYPNNVKAIN